MNHTSLPPASHSPVRSLARPSDGIDDLVQEFVDELPTRVNSMRAVMDEGAMRDLGVLAHQLRGAGGGFGFPRLTELAGALEDAIAHSEPAAEVADRLDDLTRFCRRVRAT